MATVLTMSGYTVQAAVSGADAVEVLEAGTYTPDVILMDTQMPGLSGKELIDELRKRSDAVLYAMSGSDAPAAVVAGADGFLMKPFGPEALQRVLEQHTQEIRRPAPADAPVLHAETLAQWRGLMPDRAVREIYVAVVTDLYKRIVEIYRAIEQGSAAEVKRIGHAIKGGCGMAGAREAARLGELLESGGDDLVYSRRLVGELRDAAERLKGMLEAEFPGQGSDVQA